MIYGAQGAQGPHGLPGPGLAKNSGNTYALNNELLAGIWVANKWKFIIQMFP